MVIWDIETGPLPLETVAKFKPFQPPAHPGEFSEANVKLGTAKKAAIVSAFFGGTELDVRLTELAGMCGRLEGLELCHRLQRQRSRFDVPNHHRPTPGLVLVAALSPRACADPQPYLTTFDRADDDLHVVADP